MHVLRKPIIGAIVAIAFVSTPAHICAQQNPQSPPPPAGEPVEVVKTDGDVYIKLNFQEAPLQTVLEYLSEKAGLTVVSDEPIIDGRMTVISRQPIRLTEALSLINSILKEKGLTAVLTGKTLKVVTRANAITENLPVMTGRDPDAVVPGDNVVTFVVPVSHVTATALRENLQSLVPEGASLEANEDGNALIITDTTANIRRLMQIIQALDTHMASVAEIRVFQLTNADATSVASLINNIFRQDQQGGTASRGRARNPFEMMMQMRGGPGGRGGRRGVGGGNDDNAASAQAGGTVNVQVVAAADERTNSVVVRGPAEALDIVADVIRSLDDRTIEVAGVKVFQLRYADATNVAQIINQLFGDQQSSSSQQENVPFFFRRGGPGGPGPDQAEQDTESGSKLKVSAAADSRTNTVVVTGPDAVLDVVAGVVESLDSQIPNLADVKVFHLEYADAQDTAELINEVFGQSSRTSSRTTRSNQQSQQVRFTRGGFGGLGGQQQTTQSGGVSDVAVVASADSRTNSVVVSGPADTLKIIADVIKELDENPEQERRIFVYALKNANAENLRDILNNLFTEMQALEQAGTSRTGQQFQGRQAAAPQATQTSGTSDSEDLSEETYFEADPNTNSLLCMTSTKNYEKIRPIIEELDKPVGQVLIKVLFAEVTHSNTVDLGTEFSMLNIRGDGDSTRSTQIFGKPQTLITEAGLASPTGLAVRTLEGELDITLRALQETGKLNVLSRPYVLTRNNQMATITVAEEVPIPTGTTTVAGQTQVTVDYRSDIGIVLEVTPSINPAGLVNMTVSPKITTRSADKVQISETLSAEAFATRSATTRVAVLDGQTIVIGGLIEDQISDVVKKIPLAGDVPVLGHLFKRTVKAKSKTELLIFLTPHVAATSEELTPISETEASRSNIHQDPTAAELFEKHMEGMQPGGDSEKP